MYVRYARGYPTWTRRPGVRRLTTRRAYGSGGSQSDRGRKSDFAYISIRSTPTTKQGRISLPYAHFYVTPPSADVVIYPPAFTAELYPLLYDPYMCLGRARRCGRNKRSLSKHSLVRIYLFRYLHHPY